LENIVNVKLKFEKDILEQNETKEFSNNILSKNSEFVHKEWAKIGSYLESGEFHEITPQTPESHSSPICHFHPFYVDMYLPLLKTQKG
jgi:hypothetical protein